MELAKEIIIALTKEKVKNRAILNSLKRHFSKRKSSKMLSNSQLLEAYHTLIKDKSLKPSGEIEDILRVRKIRSLSGIVIVSVLTKPFPCPGKCIFCPSQDRVPKSYLKEEPAVARAITMKYSPFKQVQTRIRALEATGHPTDKVDLRIIGGTWSFYPKNYQNWFIKECFRGANEYSAKRKAKPARNAAHSAAGGNVKQKTLKQIQKQNEKAGHRIIGITIETRPDFIDKKEIKTLRELGVTMVEPGAQSIDDNVLKINRRGHDVNRTIEATRLLKDTGFKICFQMMPNLLGSNPKKDVEMFEKLFSNPDFRPDYIKIYPCALLKEAPLYKVWEKQGYKPYNEKQLLKILIAIKKLIPYYCRIQRIIRDIPSQYVVQGGTKTSNLRQMITIIAKKEGWRCKCIRCREVKEQYNSKEKLYLFRIDYDSSEGKEIFLSFENKDRTRLYSLLRLRIPGQIVLPVLKKSAIIREVHTYGKLVPISQKTKAPQHRGLGKKLMAEAEKITKKEFGLEKITVISGIGVRGYYKTLGYSLKDTYMVKRLK
ncbi:MAG: tRNA uridine(34) 5-carboxymethylaminomethyl modification radical SAM/GNAT enzyme Elp3 [Candidatus Parcubacteria bacterium]|nr:tRNA uridine(34) 5-carboxymethylaminomethyl modification radical SAM/GNAT enzyme Elp3 [Candidatus Parcubacteria bacterium]